MSELADRVTLDQVWRWLAEVPDPEIPAISIVDLGIVRELRWVAGHGPGADCGRAIDAQCEPAQLVVTVTPTYSGCPATEVIAASILEALRAHGIEHAAMETRLSPPWTTDWLLPAAREKLRGYGIAPPVGRAGERVIDLSRLSRRLPPEPVVPCPRCTSVDTQCTSPFGSTPCKALYRCRACLEPFDYFKCH
ncbi:MAG: phenylacetate-CoA oxygenase subunit PaaJ [Nevskia sp.]